MKASSINEIKQELQNLSAKEITELCLRLARFKKENKELLTYLLFEAHDEAGYIEAVKTVIDALFAEVNITNLYFAKKSIRKILRITNKHIKYTASKQVEAYLLIHFCSSLKASGISIEKSLLIQNIYTQQIKKIKTAIATLHEDLQYDMLKELRQVE
ncbi:hypothetical protein ACQ33O_03665 [Ferruginibacter sp. SUN002]|uniref:hypothetical protein n=1 Tax=Ferruginibacter sp. SUN002 TaxID=2937789 RepID=UPI003D3650D9